MVATSTNPPTLMALNSPKPFPSMDIPSTTTTITNLQILSRGTLFTACTIDLWHNTASSDILMEEALLRQVVAQEAPHHDTKRIVSQFRALYNI